jgi:hypothetical protein
MALENLMRTSDMMGKTCSSMPDGSVDGGENWTAGEIVPTLSLGHQHRWPSGDLA